MSQRHEMNSTLWRRVRRNVLLGKETAKLDLKREIRLGNKPEKAEFAKDVMALANTPGGDGYLIFGVLDSEERQTNSPKDFIVGIDQTESTDSNYIKMIDALDYYCDPPPIIDYELLVEPTTQRAIGIVTVKRSWQKPHGFSVDSPVSQKNHIPIRRGSRTFPQASPSEIKAMLESAGEVPSAIVVAFHGHPLTDMQKEQISSKFVIEEIVEVDVHFDDSSILEQARSIVQQSDLTLDEWSSGEVILVPPGLAPPAIVLVAYIHGLTGNFPKLGWLEKGKDSTGQYILREVIDVQLIREIARKDRPVLGS